jgi:general secretion pathway protein K
MNGRRQSGVALLAALLVVAIAVVLVAALLDAGEAGRSRSRNALRAEQTWQLLHGLEGWAGAALQRDQAQEADVDSSGEPWLLPLPPIDIPGGRLNGRLRDRSGCFNVNQVVVDGSEDPIARARLERLLAALKLDPTLAARLLDWIDSDAIPSSGGAEDQLYLQRQPAYLTAAAPLAHVSELRLLLGVDAEVYGRLAGELCALPADALINLNFASPALWMSLDPRITEGIAMRMWNEGRARYRSTDEIAESLRQLGVEPVNLLGTSTASRFVVADAVVESDGIPFAYSSLLERSPAGVRVLARARGRL